MLVTYKKDGVIKVNPISNNQILVPKQAFTSLVTSVDGISGEIYTGAPCVLNLDQVGIWGKTPTYVTSEEIDRVCKITSTWLDLHPAKVE
jgi:hypothetical protein